MKGLSKCVISLILIIFSTISLESKMIESEWTKTFWGSEYDFHGYSVQQTTDGGYIIAGSKDYNAYLLKTDSIGDTLWTRTFGPGTGNSVQQTNDGGYIVAGRKSSDLYLLKTNSIGDTLWTRTFGPGTGNSVQQTDDKGYILAGRKSSDVYLLKTDSMGNTLWTKSFGGTGDDGGQSVQRTNDGGYIVAGYTYSFGTGEGDIYLIKINPLVNSKGGGDTLWTKTYGGTGDERGYSVQQIDDGGYIIAGYTTSYGAGESDIYLIKTNSLGNTLWTKTFGGRRDERGYSVQQTEDGGYIFAGYTTSYGAGSSDAYLIKTDSLGNKLWTKTFGGSDSDWVQSVQQTSDGGYISTGTKVSSLYYFYAELIYLIKLKRNLSPYIAVVSPNGEEDLQADSTYDIKWISHKTSNEVKIEYSLNGGIDWAAITDGTPDDGSHPWTIPDTTSTNCLISVSDIKSSAYAIVSDTTDGMFTIYSGPFIRVIYPNGGERLLCHDSLDIAWRSVGTSGNIRIEYSTNNGFDWITIADTLIADTVLDEKTYSWAPDSISDSCLIRVTDTLNIISDISDETFTIWIFDGIPTTNLPENYSLDVKGVAINGQLEFNYTLPEKTNTVKFAVYNILGAKIKEEVLKENPAGSYSGNINMSGVSKGIYFIRIEIDRGKFIQTKKFLLM